MQNHKYRNHNNNNNNNQTATIRLDKPLEYRINRGRLNDTRVFDRVTLPD